MYNIYMKILNFNKLFLYVFLILNIFITNISHAIPVPNQDLFVPNISDLSVQNKDVVDCFDYYKFGSVDIDISSDSKYVVSGTKMDFSGYIYNQNDYPIVDGLLYVRIVRNDNKEKNIQGGSIVDQFVAVDNINIPAKQKKNIEFNWKIPTNIKTGDYSINSYFISNKKFNLSGLSFTDDVVGKSYDFIIKGGDKFVEFDKKTALLNNNIYGFAAYPPRVDKDKDANISIGVKSNLDYNFASRIKWRLYKWDSVNPDNLIREFDTFLEIKSNNVSNIEVTISDNTEPVYYLVGEFDYKGVKSLVNFRFVREGVDKARINFPGILKFPIKKGESNTIFSCLHNSGMSDFIENKSMLLEIKNMDGDIVQSYTYKNSISGKMMGVKKDFVSKKNLDKFLITATIFDDKNNIIDKSVLNYDCDLIDKNLCLPKDKSIIYNIILVFIVFVIIFIIFNFRNNIKDFIKKIFNFIFRKNNIIKLFLISLMFLTIDVHAAPNATSTDGFTGKRVSWVSSTLPGLSYFWNRFTGSGWAAALSNAVVTVNYGVNIRKTNDKTEVQNAFDLSKCGNVLVGDYIDLLFKRGTYLDISWVGTGYTQDSPYGAWGGNTIEGIPVSGGCSTDNYVNSAYLFGFKFDIHITLWIAPPVKSISNINTSKLNCNPLEEVSITKYPNNDVEMYDYIMTCHVINTGTSTPVFNISSTTGMFTYAYYDYRDSRPYGDNTFIPGCYSSDAPLSTIQSLVLLGVEDNVNVPIKWHFGSGSGSGSGSGQEFIIDTAINTPVNIELTQYTPFVLNVPGFNIESCIIANNPTVKPPTPIIRGPSSSGRNVENVFEFTSTYETNIGLLSNPKDMNIKKLIGVLDNGMLNVINNIFKTNVSREYGDLNINKKNIGNIRADTPTTNPTDVLVKYGMDWDNNGVVDEFTDYFGLGVWASSSKAWAQDGIYTFAVKAVDQYGNESNWSTFNITIAGNHVPTAPTIIGSNNAILDQNYNINLTSTDPDGDNIKYEIDWENVNNNYSSLPGTNVYVNSGTTVIGTHVYSLPLGVKNIKARAIDENGGYSDWSYYNIEVVVDTNNTNCGCAFNQPEGMRIYACFNNTTGQMLSYVTDSPLCNIMPTCSAYTTESYPKVIFTLLTLNSINNVKYTYTLNGSPVSKITANAYEIYIDKTNTLQTLDVTAKDMTDNQTKTVTCSIDNSQKLSINLSLSNNKPIIDNGSSCNISWTITNRLSDTDCKIKFSGVSDENISTTTLTGSKTYNNIQSNKKFTIQCSNPNSSNQNVSESVYCRVRPDVKEK